MQADLHLHGLSLAHQHSDSQSEAGAAAAAGCTGAVRRRCLKLQQCSLWVWHLLTLLAVLPYRRAFCFHRLMIARHDCIAWTATARHTHLTWHTCTRPTSKTCAQYRLHLVAYRHEYTAQMVTLTNRHNTGHQQQLLEMHWRRRHQNACISVTGYMCQGYTAMNIA